MVITSILLGIMILAQSVLVGLLIFVGRRLEPLVDRLEQASADNRAAALTFRSAIGALVIQSDETGATVLRIEAAAIGVASDLHKSQERADAVDSSAPHGQAADAASRGEVDDLA